MTVRLRLMRMGKKKQPTYRVVAADKRKARNGKFIEVIGFYDPKQDPSVIEIENEKAVHWLNNGAQPSERVEKLLKISGAWDDFKGLPEGTSVTNRLSLSRSLLGKLKKQQKQLKKLKSQQLKKLKSQQLKKLKSQQLKKLKSQQLKKLKRKRSHE